jgi:putative tryptophan/tyrosine transport system substrate-binding protein
MSKTMVVFVLAVAILASVSLADAQQRQKVPWIGWLAGGSALSVARNLEAFRQGLRELGYFEGKNIVVEYRYAEDKLDRLPDLAVELVELKVDIIVTQGTPAAQAAKKATSRIPIVMASSGDAVGSGLVASLAHPGGNVTGLSFLATELEAKRLELLKEIVPRISRVVYLSNPAIVAEMISLKSLQSVGPALGVTVQPVVMRASEDFESVFAAVVRERANGAMVSSNGSYIPRRHEIVALAAKHRLPVAYGWRDFPEAGGLMSYGAISGETFRRAATYVDKILKGAKPADLPVEQPMKFDLVINLKTAKELGLTIPPEVLVRADKVIK